MRIVVTNDDGFESVNLQALFTALKQAGHDVILCAPYSDQSGTSARVRALADVSSTTRSSPGGVIQAGAPGIGPTTIAADQYYVDDAPATALIYALDALAPAKWSADPELVISGPNAGNNLGSITPHSGTVGAAVTALNRGIPAIAISGANADPAGAALLAQITLRVVDAVIVRNKISLPWGVGLNVNVPALDPSRSAASYVFSLTQVAADVASGSAVAAVALDRPAAEFSVFSAGEMVTVSPIEGTYRAQPEQAARVYSVMRALFATMPTIANPKFVNLSVRGYVGTGDAVQVVGFAVAGTTAKTVLVRAAGPSLADFKVAGPLEDPAVTVYRANGDVVAANDNWGDDPAQAAAVAAAAGRIGAYPWSTGSRDAALLVTLPPGLYSVVVRGAGHTTGVALAEIYDAGID